MIAKSHSDLAGRLASYVNPRRLIPTRSTELWRAAEGITTIVSDAAYQTDVVRLNDGGSILWSLADGAAPLASIASAAMSKLGMSPHPSVALGHALQFYRRLEEQGAIRFAVHPGMSLPATPPVDVLLLTTPDPIHYLPEAAGIAENSAPPLGLLYVAAGIQRAGLRVAVADLNIHGADFREIELLVSQAEPRIVGISVLTAVSEIAKLILRTIRRLDPTILLVAGGPHPSVLPGHFLVDECADVVVRGEGDESMAKLAVAALAGASFDVVPGISFLRAGVLVDTPDADPSLDVNFLPQPARDLVRGDDYVQAAPIVTSRGCTHSCLFCSSVLLRNRRYRPRNVDDVLREVDCLRSDGNTHFEVQDDDLSSDPARLRQLADAFAKRSIKWACQCTVSALKHSPDLIHLLARSGCQQVFCGIESGYQPILQRQKGITISDVDLVLRGLIDAGLRAVASFIIGWPQDTRDTINRTVEYALQLRELGVHTPFSILTPFPGTPLYSEPDRHGIRIECDDFTNYTFSRANISTTVLSRDDLNQLYLDAIVRLSETYPHEDVDLLNVRNNA